MTKHIKTLKPQTKQVAPSTKQLSELLTVAEVARILRVDSTTVRRWITQGTLEAVVLPHPNERQAYRIKRKTLDSLLEAPTHATK